MKPATSVRAVLGWTLRLLRERAGISQRAMAELTGISQALWSRTERGRMPIRINRLYIVSRELGMQPSEIILRAEAASEALELAGVRVVVSSVLESDETLIEIADAAVKTIVSRTLDNNKFKTKC